MHVALIVDEERLAHEHTTLNRLSIGLIGDGVQLTRIIPETLPSAAADEVEQRMALATKLQTPMKVLPWSRRGRTERLVEAMEKSPPDVLYAMGDEAWSLGLDLARTMERPVALDLWSAEQVRRVPRGHRAASVAAYTVPTRPISEALGQRVDPALVRLVRTGVAMPAQPREILADPENDIALAILGGGRDVPAYRAMLAGLSTVVRVMPQIQAFLELSGPHEHDIWQQARKLDLLHNVSAITDAARHRSLLTRCDVLLLPERFGEVRSVILEAMAFGMPVLAGDDPHLDMLEHGASAVIVANDESEEWGRHLKEILGDPEKARTLGRAAHDRIAAEHRSSSHVECLVDTFQRIVTGGSYPFRAPDA
jgi:hypothetical protein